MPGDAEKDEELLVNIVVDLRCPLEGGGRAHG
jgi:hypothetical protein